MTLPHRLPDAVNPAYYALAYLVPVQIGISVPDVARQLQASSTILIVALHSTLQTETS
jgi:hypothetical protein